MAFNRNKSLAKAQKLLQKGKVADAIKVYQEVVDSDPTDVRTLLKVGDLQAKLGDIDAANDTYRKVAEHYAKDGFFLKAVAVFKQILRLDPGLIAIYLRLAELYQQLGLNSEAMKQYQTVVRHYESKGLKKESLDVLRKMAELDPENTASRVKLAELYVREGHNEAASEQFLSVINDLKSKDNYRDLGRVYEKMEGLGICDAASKLELSEIYLKTAEPKKALERLQELFEKDPKNHQVLELLARSFLDLQQAEKAKSVYKELVNILNEKGMTEARDRITAKLRTLGVSEETASLAPSSDAPSTGEAPTDKPPLEAVDTSKVLAEIDVLLQYGLVEKACTLLKNATVKDPSDPAIRTKLIESYGMKKDETGLVDVLNQALQTAQTHSMDGAISAIKEELGKISPSTVSETSETKEDPIGLDVPLDEDLDLEIVDDEEPQPVAKDASVKAASADVELDFSEEFEREDDAGELPLDLSEEGEPEEPSAGKSFEIEQDVESMSAAEFDLDIGDIEEAVSSGEEELAEATAIESKAETPEEPEAEPIAEILEEELDVSVEAEAEPELEEPEELHLESEGEPEPEAVPKLVPEPERIEIVEEEVPEGAGYDFDSFETEMEEAAFFIEQGLLEEAVEVYETVLEQDENYQPAVRALAELKQTLGKTSKPAVTAVPKRSVVEEDAIPKRSKSSDRVLKEAAAKKSGEIVQEKEEFFDLSSELQDEILDLEESLSEKKSPDEEEYLSPEEVISEFKKGVARTVAKDDYQTHYSLGIAYKEMGLLDEAIHQFDHAAQDPDLVIDCASMIGLCLIGKREFDTAIDVYRRALARTSPQAPEALGLSYELAEAYIGHGNMAAAFKLFARIHDIEPTFRDVRRRARELEADLGDAAPHPSAPEKPAKGEKVVEFSKKKTKITYI